MAVTDDQRDRVRPALTLLDAQWERDEAWRAARGVTLVGWRPTRPSKPCYPCASSEHDLCWGETCSCRVHRTCGTGG